MPAVPVADAEENLRLIIEKVRAAGGTVLLLPELTRPTPRDPMAEYRRMEAAVGTAAPGAAWLDVVEAMAEVDPEAVFVDRNHLSRTGHAELAGRITPQVLQLLAPAAEGGP